MINANTPAANYYVPTPNAAPQPSQVLRSGNPAESEAASFLHRDANLAADKQASTNSQLLNLSAPLIGARTHQQRMYGLSLNSGLLRLGDIHSGNVVTARCYPMAEENTKPTPEPRPNGGTKPAADQPKPNVDTLPVVDKPKPNVGTLPVVDKSKPNVDTLPVVDKPKPNIDTMPVVDKPKPNVGTLPVVDKPKPNVDTLPVVDKPKPNVDTLPVVDKPKQPRDTRTDDTTYGFNSNTGKAETTLTSAADKPDFNVWDERGNDTFDFSGFKQDQIINLRGGSFSSVGGMKENVRIGEKTVIENAVGGHGNDRIIGNSADNVLTGGAGGDTLVGGGGWNTFKFNAFSDSTRANADLLLDFNTGQDKIDLSQMVLDGKVALNFVENYTGAAGDTIIKFNPQTGRYLLAVDLDGDGKTDFLIKSTRMISPEDVIGLNIKEGSYL